MRKAAGPAGWLFFGGNTRQVMSRVLMAECQTQALLTAALIDSPSLKTACADAPPGRAGPRR